MDPVRGGEPPRAAWTSVEAAATSLVPLGGADPVPEDDRGGEHHDRDDEGTHDDVDRPGGEVRGESDEEEDDRDEQRRVADALADLDEAAMRRRRTITGSSSGRGGSALTSPSNLLP